MRPGRGGWRVMWAAVVRWGPGQQGSALITSLGCAQGCTEPGQIRGMSRSRGTGALSIAGLGSCWPGRVRLLASWPPSCRACARCARQVRENKSRGRRQEQDLF